MFLVGCKYVDLLVNYQDLMMKCKNQSTNLRMSVKLRSSDFNYPVKIPRPGSDKDISCFVMIAHGSELHIVRPIMYLEFGNDRDLLSRAAIFFTQKWLPSSNTSGSSVGDMTLVSIIIYN